MEGGGDESDGLISKVAAGGRRNGGCQRRVRRRSIHLPFTQQAANLQLRLVKEGETLPASRKTSIGVVGCDGNTPEGVQKAGLGDGAIAGSQQMLRQCRISREFSIRASKDDILRRHSQSA